MIKKTPNKKNRFLTFLRRYAIAFSAIVTLIFLFLLEYFTMIPSHLVEMARPSITREESPQVCTKEYSPVCGKDGNTYSNSCMARAQKVSIVRFGSCEDSQTTLDIPAVPTTTTPSSNSSGSISLSGTTETFDTGSYQIYENKNFGYTLALPKYAYYQGNPGTSGASHVLTIGTSATEVSSLENSPIRVYFYPLGASPSIEGRQIPVSRGILVIDGTGGNNPKLSKIIETIALSGR